MLIDVGSMPTFPRHPQDYSGEGEMTCFEANTPGNNYRRAQLSVLFRFMFPKLEDPAGPAGRRFSGKMLVPEYATLGEYIQGMIQGYCIEHGPSRTWIHQALNHENGQDAQLLIVTKNARVLGIPWNTKVGDLWPGAKWPRSSPTPFRLLRQPPLNDPKRVDGIVFEHGHSVLVHVVSKVAVQALWVFCGDVWDRNAELIHPTIV